MDFTNLDEYEFSYVIEKDGEKIFENSLKLCVEPHQSVNIEIPYEPAACSYGVYLTATLTKDGKICAKTQHALPCEIVEVPLAAPAVLTEDELFIYASGENFSYTFSRHYGTFTSMIVNGREQIVDRPVLSAFRAPTDNDRNIKQYWANLNVWEGENLDTTFSKVYDCFVDGNMIIVDASIAGVSRSPFLRYTQIIEIFADGQINFSVDGHIRPDTFWLPRLGFEFTLPGAHDAFTYYGRGPIENYRDMHNAAPVGLYSSTAASEYVNYVFPQEHGNHYETKMLHIGDLEFTASDSFEINVSEYTPEILFKAKHTDELTKDGNVHLRVDYKVSGIGSNSCGPALEKEYRLAEKAIHFAFSVKPV